MRTNVIDILLFFKFAWQHFQGTGIKRQESSPRRTRSGRRIRDSNGHATPNYHYATADLKPGLYDYKSGSGLHTPYSQSEVGLTEKYEENWSDVIVTLTFDPWSTILMDVEPEQ